MVADGLTAGSGLFCPELSTEGLSNWVHEESASSTNSYICR